MVVMASWRLALNNDVNELIAIACTIRNWVVPRFGAATEPMIEKAYHPSYSSAVAEFLQVYPAREFPQINEGALVDPVEGMLLKIDEIYDCRLIDITSSRAFPAGARYFGRAANPTEWFKRVVLDRQNIHKLIGTFGSQQFFE